MKRRRNRNDSNSAEGGHSRRFGQHTVMSAVDRIKSFVAREVGPDIPVFSPGQDRSAIQLALRDVGQALPPSYLDFLGLADGQHAGCPIVFPPGQLKLLSCARAVALWAELKALADEDDAYFETTADDGRVRALLYDARRFPVAYDEGGLQYVFIDGVPGPNGRMGQLISNPAEATFEVIAPDFGSWIESLAAMLETGRARLMKAADEFGGGYRFESPAGALLTCAEVTLVAN